MKSLRARVNASQSMRTGAAITMLWAAALGQATPDRHDTRAKYFALVSGRCDCSVYLASPQVGTRNQVITYRLLYPGYVKKAAFGSPFSCAPSMGAILEVQVLP